MMSRLSCGALARRAWKNATQTIWAAPLCAVLAGCGGAADVAPVSGRVTLDGQPVANVAVNFAPEGTGAEAGRPAYATTDAEGRFELRLIDNDAIGAAVGANRVTLHENFGSEDYDDTPTQAAYRLPPSARDGTLNFDVPQGGTDAADFEF